MPSLKEIKGRIASVASTLKITSAMKMVASAKLHRAQQAIGNMLPYEKQLHRMLGDLMELASKKNPSDSKRYSLAGVRDVHKVAIVAFASNSSLCGAFNSVVIAEAFAAIDRYRAAGLSDSDITVYSVGRKMADAMRKAGFPSPADFSTLSATPTYDAASELAQELIDSFIEGKYDKVEMVYNHYKSTASQPTVSKVYLPLSLEGGEVELNSGHSKVQFESAMPAIKDYQSLIVEPNVEDLIEMLLPKVLRLGVFTTLLDCSAAEHAARTVAMQNATDNGEDLLQELSLEYNKSRQQKITNEILDLAGGSMM